jgi:hypothetical protein
MNNQIAYTIGSKSLVVFLPNSGPKTVSKDHPLYQKVEDYILGTKVEDFDPEVLEGMLSRTKKFVSWSNNSGLSITNGVISYNGQKIHNGLTKRILSLMDQNKETSPLVNFLDNLMKNPSRTSVNELYLFLEHNDLPITPDGCFLAYKKVKDNYFDCHSGTIDNSVGQKPSMPRNEVDDRRENTCSQGLHFCSYSYLAHFQGARVVVLKINPADVVSIPSDYNNAKGRCSTYEVIAEIPLETLQEDNILEKPQDPYGEEFFNEYLENTENYDDLYGCFEDEDDTYDYFEDEDDQEDNEVVILF